MSDKPIACQVKLSQRANARLENIRSSLAENGLSMSKAQTLNFLLECMTVEDMAKAVNSVRIERARRQRRLELIKSSSLTIADIESMYEPDDLD